MLSELIQNRMKNADKLSELLESYDVAELGRKIQEQRVNEIYDRVLQENEFFSSDDYIMPGDRITEEVHMWLLSEEDMQRVFDLARPILVAENITDENGFYLTNWTTQSLTAWRDLVNFIIQEILPSPFKEIFWENRLNVPKMDKLIEAVRKIA